MEEKKKFTCDILGVCETRRRSEKEVKWNDGHMIYLGSGSGPRSVGGIGFIINKKWSSKIMSCSIRSARIGTLMLKLDAKKAIKIVQIYAPTSAAEDWEVEEFYQELDQVLKVRSTYTVVTGDCNAKVGRKRPGEKFVGKCGIGMRNERGERLVTWAES